MICSSCGQPMSDDLEYFSYVLSRIHVNPRITVEGTRPALLSRADVGERLHRDDFTAQWHFCSRDCLHKWVSEDKMPPEPLLER